MNVNDDVRVKLLPLGIADMERLRVRPYYATVFKPDPEPPYYCGQLFQFMAAFGAYMNLGFDVPFTEFYFTHDPVLTGLRELVEGGIITTSRAAEIMGITVAEYRERAYPRQGHLPGASDG